MAVDDAAASPERLAAEIHRQLGHIAPPIPVHDIARALDIDEIKELPLGELEGMLITEAIRDFGTIAVNSSSYPARRRYSVGHELGHFLCHWHIQTQGKMFECSRRDMSLPKGSPVHVRQENEANRFAIELLAPVRFFAPYRKRVPDLEHVLALNAQLHISKTAAARRYVDLHRKRVAVIFAQDGKYLYCERSSDFPFIRFERGQPLPILPKVGQDTAISQMVEANAEEWLGPNQSHELSIQCLRQDQGHAIVMLYVEDGEADHP